jgi:hypothetical protein
MESNYICGVVLSKATAQHYFELAQSLHNIATYTLDCDNRFGLTSQKQHTWSLRSARHPDPLDEKISDIKSRIHSCHVGLYEDWKAIKYESAVKWPVSPYAGSLWRTFAKTMDQDQPIYEMRNWFSHDFGKRGGTLEVENEKFTGLQEAYGSSLPCLTEMLLKLEEGLQDEAAWVGQSEVKARRNEEDQPEYTKDTMVVQLEIAAAHEKFLASMKQAEIEFAARVARTENGEDAWGCEEWVMTEDVGEGWGSDPENPQAAVSWANLDEGVEDLCGSVSDTDDDTSEWADDLPAVSTQLDHEYVYDSGFEDDNDEPRTTVCKATTDPEYVHAALEKIPHDASGSGI